MEYLELLLKGLIVLFPIAFCWMLITYKWRFRKIEKEPTKVLVTGAAGQIGYAILPMIARGVMLGPDQPVTLHLFDNIKQADEALNGIKMELIDAAFPLLKGVIATTDIVEACKDVNIAVMLGGFPRKEGMERTDMMSKNVSMYMAQASALAKHAVADCKVLVFAKPSNTNALILKEFAPSIPKKNITCLTRLDHNRALNQIAKRLKVHASDVKNIIIWGNHSSTHYPNVNHATFTTKNGERLVREHVADDHWLKTEFIKTVQHRGLAIIKARKASSALSAASAACDHIRDWVFRTPKGTWVSMGVCSDGSYGIKPGLIYSFPIKCENGKWSIVQGKIGYAIIPMIARGIMLGPDQPVILHLLDIEQTNEALNSLKMELLGSAFPLLKQVVVTNDNVEACKDVNIAIMIAGYSRKDGTDTKDLMSKNVSIYKGVASVLEQHAAADCKVLVVTNPANTNALILKDFAPSIPEKNITCLTRLDHNIALSLIAEKVKVPVSNVKNVIIWGNHYANQYPDINHATVTIKNEEKPVKECISDDHWLKTEFITNVQQRGAAWNRSQKATNSAFSCASAACDHIHDWVYGTPKGKWVSMGVYSDGSYGIEPGLIYSFPVKCEKGKWSIVQGLTIDALTKEKMDVAAKDLKEEISMAKSCLD